ncbi:hypothetical protein FORC065_1172 [Yersinia enterocolitica]|nr:hypothetical protein FORC065_1172 [Yersinia enterocolitica]
MAKGIFLNSCSPVIGKKYKKMADITIGQSKRNFHYFSY